MFLAEPTDVRCDQLQSSDSAPSIEPPNVIAIFVLRLHPVLAITDHHWRPLHRALDNFGQVRQDVLLADSYAACANFLPSCHCGRDPNISQQPRASYVGILGFIPSANGSLGGVEVDQVLIDESRLFGREGLVRVSHAATLRAFG
jgi:hypothetical protein